MGKGRLLSVKEVGKLPASDKQYYVKKVNYPEQNGLYKMEELPYFRDDNGNNFGRTCFAVTCGEYKVYEYEEEEIIIKEYTTVEAIKELDSNIGLKFQALSFSDNKPFEKFLTSGEGKRLTCTKSPDYNDNIYMDQKWILVKPEPIEVPFMEAVKAFSIGKVIECRREEYTSRYKDGNNHPVMCDDNGLAINYREILKGKWFIL